MPEIELKPCPFCGAAAQIITVITRDGIRYRIMCGNSVTPCQVFVATRDCEKIEDAADAWNSRYEVDR